MFFYKRITQNLSVNLDIIRFVAASLVMLSHLRGSYFEKFNSLTTESQNPINYILFFLTQLGGEAVVIFFVLSGFLVGGANISSYMSNSFSFKKNIIDRLSRLWTVLIPVLFLSIIFNFITYRISGEENLIDSLSLNIFLGNILFLQTIFVPVFGLNDPLWSLANEFWYYMIWGMVLFIFKKINPKSIFITSLLLAVTYYLAPHILIQFPLWIMGVAIRFIPVPKNFKSNYMFFISLLLFFLSLLFSSLYRDDNNLIPTNYIVAFFFGFWLWVLMHTDEEIFPKFIFNSNFWTFAASFSFSLYAIHFVLQIFLYQFLKEILNIPIRISDASILNWIGLLGIIIFVYLFSYLFYLISEKHTNTIRNFLYNTFRINKI